MMTLRFEHVWTGKNVARNVDIVVDAEGHIVSLGRASDTKLEVQRGLLIPGMINAHSHAFQYAMAGLTEHISVQSPSDDFWSWRRAMYGLANRLQPEHVFAIAATAYLQMLKAGYTHVVEFHYLHHDLDGKPYTDRGVVAEQIMEAARTVGIGMTMVPVLYQTSGFSKPATAEQRRFICRELVEYREIISACRLKAGGEADMRVGVGVHSLRAAPANAIEEVLLSQRPCEPFHIHIAEQTGEVDQCVAATGKRPVEYFLEIAAATKLSINLVHATHMIESECAQVAGANATVVICPTTEANLGDGVFSYDTFSKLDGEFAIGSDSHVCTDFLQELRALEYSQRLMLRRRNVAASLNSTHSGATLFEKALSGGCRSAGLEKRSFSVGAPLDGMLVDLEHPAFLKKPSEHWLDVLVFASDSTCYKATYKRGRKVIDAHRHSQEKDILQGYQDTLDDLRL